MHIGLNAHLLSRQSGYRSAGIHSYINGLLGQLRRAAPDDWTLTAYVGAASTAEFPGIAMRRSRLDTESPLRRILWEQGIQPFTMDGVDLHHALAFVAPALARCPSVVTMYDLSFIHYPERLSTSRRLYLRWFSALTCRRARRVIAISESTARDVIATLGIAAEKVDVAAPGYDAAAFRLLPSEEVRAFRAVRGLPDRFWLFIGTLEPRKNLPVLIDAYAALRPADRLPLILAGGKGWDYQPILDAVERHGLRESVQFPGFIPSDDLPFWYNCAETFVYPSVFEGFGLPVLEAMACGTPVIASSASSLPEVVGDAGMCISPQDSTAWTEGLRRATQDSGWRDSAAAMGTARARQFSWSETARLTVGSYTRAMNLQP
ncbi:MAG: glycosyltransferase family 4 protein [Anaerolineae bacterium]|nr:glycosyltransferase family 4 protein [Anaerolineae bacterium]NUQ03809.1 glycosyltransferase family 4 protein [Anaerolineae bacterium]